jgi:hypothetical protein
MRRSSRRGGRGTLGLASAIAILGACFVRAAASGAQETTPRHELVMWCTSIAGSRAKCPMTNPGTVTLVQSIGLLACERDRTWGYDGHDIWVANGCSGKFTVAPPSTRYGTYTPLAGFKLADTDQGTVVFKVYAYVRYLNQFGLDPRFIDAFHDTTAIQLRQDIQFQKVLIHFLGWLLDEKFRYHLYAWTTNTSQGLSAQVVIAGDLSYTFNSRLTLGGGTSALPGVRSTEGNFPLWLPADNRPIADEFFRPSYTFGVWIKGALAPGLVYMTMLGNNLSQLGINAGQLDHGLNTWSSALVWMPTTKEFGTQGSYGDFDNHQKAATRIGIHYTRSDENFQGQLSNSSFDNVQIRLSDGNIIFKPDLFGPGISITDAAYHMGTVDGGVKYHGFSLEAEQYWRGVNHFRGPKTSGVRALWDYGFQAQASGMIVQKRFQAYVGSSRVNGQFGDPWDARYGVNWYPFATQVVRWNLEYLRLLRSPVGGFSLPYTVGANGYVIYSTFEVNF